MRVSEGSCRTRFATCAFFSIGLLLFTTVVDPGWQPAHAQEGAAPAESAGGEGPAPEVKENLFKHIIRSAGWFFGPIILLISIGLVALIVLLTMDLRMATCIPPSFVDEFTDTVNKRRFKEAFELARAEPSFLGRVLTAGMGRLQYGLEDAREAARNTVDSVKAGKDQLINYLATIGTLGPMIGLVGTVFGMILAFMELGHGTPDAAKLAAGISHALVLTLLGVGLALPAIFFHNFYRNRLTRLTMDTANIADDLLTQMYHNSRKPAPATVASAETRPAPAAVARPAQ
jgi:biopolymer transport protein ExbB